MRLRTSLLVPALLLSGAQAGCPGAASPRPEREARLAAPAPAIAVMALPPAPTAIAAAVPPPPIEPPPPSPELAPSLPPELADDGSDDVPETPDLPDSALPLPSPAPAIVDAASEPAGPELASVAKETWVYAEPRWKARRIGYLRAGAVVARHERPAGFTSCEGGWYRVEPRGFVCVGATATLDVFDPVVTTSATRPRMDDLPYTYVMSRFPPPPMYARLPTLDEQRKVETDLASHLRKVARTSAEALFVAPPPDDPLPWALLYGRPLPPFANQWRSADALVLERARVRSGHALLSTFDHEGRRFGLTTDLALVPIDRTRVVAPSTFAGAALGDEVTLPLAFVRSRHASRFVAAEGGGLTRGEPVAFREAIPLGGPSKRAGGVTYLQARDGSFVREDQVVVASAFTQRPSWAVAGRKWVDVSILRQTLVAYEGDRPVRATLVSTGRDGIGDPEKTHSTAQGVFLIHTKHVSTTMDGDDAGDEFDLRDVPFVQYFHEGFALHGAYWHDEFGTPRSHGCVNLSPKDAAWLFGWTTPDVPEHWHAALTLKKGTLVYTHP